MVRRIGSFVVLVLLGTFVLAACGTENDEVQPTVTRIPVVIPPTATEGAAAGGETTQVPGGPVTIDIKLEDIMFDKKEITVPVDTDVTINVTNAGASTHNFSLDAFNVKTKDLDAGASETLTFNSGSTVGDFEYYCDVPGHKEAGMVGTLHVVAATAPAPAGTPVTGGGATPAVGGGASPAAELPTTLDIAMEDIKFDITAITVPANTEITINLTNKGAATHGFDIDELKVQSGEYAAGQTGKVTFNSGAPGEYVFYCPIPGHKEAGMVGKITVVDSGAVGGVASNPPPSAAAAPTTFDLKLEDIKFDITEITVPANSDITINLTNAGAATHGFDIDELKVQSGEYAAGQTGKVTFDSGAPGEYVYYCPIPGHKEAGMVGKLIVK